MRIELSRNKFVIVSEEDFEYLSQFNWCYKDYARRNILMHRGIAERMGLDLSNEIDHINGDKLDNRRENLRSATRSQNMMNSGKPKNNTSGHKGVSWHRNKWEARIIINGKKKHLGCFEDKEEAAKAYKEAAEKYFGEFATNNVILLLGKKILLPKNKFAIVSEEDYDLSQFSWCYNRYAYRTILMHREIAERMGLDLSNDIDHINGDKLDNRRENLRSATRSQNKMNRGKQKNNTSGHKGVSWHRNKWQVKIQVNSKQKHLGLFDDIEEAAKTYKKAAEKYHSNFAKV